MTINITEGYYKIVYGDYDTTLNFIDGTVWVIGGEPQEVGVDRRIYKKGEAYGKMRGPLEGLYTLEDFVNHVEFLWHYDVEGKKESAEYFLKWYHLTYEKANG